MADGRLLAAMSASVCLLIPGPVAACPVYMQPDPEDARDAHAIVVGRASELRIEPTYRWRDANRRRWLRNLLAGEQRRGLDGVTDRVRLTIEVRQVVAGDAPRQITVDWLRETNNGPPGAIRGEYLFALRKSPAPTPEETYGDFGVLQSVCQGALVLETGSVEANAVRAMFGLPAEAPRSETGPRVELSRAPVAPPSIWFVVGGVGIAGAVFAGVLLGGQRRRPKRETRV